MVKSLIKKLIRIYTPFICAVVAIIHGVLFLCEYQGVLMLVLGEFTGHSLLLIAYILSTCKHMCIWYKLTNWILFFGHAINIMYYFDLIDQSHIIYILILLNILALISFLIYRITVGITKFLC
jgi:hypothetical protein